MVYRKALDQWYRKLASRSGMVPNKNLNHVAQTSGPAGRWRMKGQLRWLLVETSKTAVRKRLLEAEKRWLAYGLHKVALYCSKRERQKTCLMSSGSWLGRLPGRRHAEWFPWLYMKHCKTMTHSRIHSVFKQNLEEVHNSPVGKDSQMGKNGLRSKTKPRKVPVKHNFRSGFR